MLMTEYAHIRERIRYIFEGSDEERMLFIRANEYVPNDRSKRIIAATRDLVEANHFHSDEHRNPRPGCILIKGNSGMGKTFIMEKLVTMFKTSIDERSGHPVLRLVFVKCPNVTDLRNFLARILRAVGVPFCYEDRPDKLCEQALCALRDAGIVALLIDELHNFLAAGSKLADHMRVLRDFANLPLSLIAAGLWTTENVVSSDDQLDSRFDRYALDPWNTSSELRNFLATFECGMPLRKPSNLAGQELMPLLVRLSLGNTRFMVRAILRAAEFAITSETEQITEEALKASASELRSLGNVAPNDIDLIAHGEASAEPGLSAQGQVCG